MTVTSSVISGGSIGITNNVSGIFYLNFSTVQQSAGSGIENNGTMSTFASVITQNGSPNHSGGGGFTNGGTLTINASLVIGNVAYVGGGIQNWGNLTVINSTITGNSVPPSPPTPPDVPGPGIFSYYGAVVLSHATMSNNTVSGVPYPQAVVASDGSVTIYNSILANGVRECLTGTGVVVSGDYNVTLGTCFSAPQTHDVIADPRLGGLSNNGGPTLTQALLTGSPAIDRAPLAGGHCPSADQRGAPRPQGAACDSGAYEVGQIVAPVPVAKPSAPPLPAPAPMPAARPTAPVAPPPPNPLPPPR